MTDDRNEITNKEKQILIDIGQIFITVVKCLDVFTEKLQLVFVLMWTFHFGKGGGHFLFFSSSSLTGRLNEGIHKFSQQTKLGHC